MPTKKHAHGCLQKYYSLPSKLRRNQDVLQQCELTYKLWYIQTTEYYAVLKKELSSHEKTRRKLKCIWLSDRSQSEKDTYHKLPTVYDILLKKKERERDSKKSKKTSSWQELEEEG